MEGGSNGPKLNQPSRWQSLYWKLGRVAANPQETEDTQVLVLRFLDLALRRNAFCQPSQVYPMTWEAGKSKLDMDAQATSGP